MFLREGLGAGRGLPSGGVGACLIPDQAACHELPDHGLPVPRDVALVETQASSSSDVFCKLAGENPAVNAVVLLGDGADLSLENPGVLNPVQNDRGVVHERFDVSQYSVRPGLAEEAVHIEDSPSLDADVRKHPVVGGIYWNEDVVEVEHVGGVPGSISIPASCEDGVE